MLSFKAPKYIKDLPNFNQEEFDNFKCFGITNKELYSYFLNK